MWSSHLLARLYCVDGIEFARYHHAVEHILVRLPQCRSHRSCSYDVMQAGSSAACAQFAVEPRQEESLDQPLYICSLVQGRKGAIALATFQVMQAGLPTLQRGPCWDSGVSLLEGWLSGAASGWWCPQCSSYTSC
jgi:hypothetical protein